MFLRIFFIASLLLLNGLKLLHAATLIDDQAINNLTAIFESQIPSGESWREIILERIPDQVVDNYQGLPKVYESEPLLSGPMDWAFYRRGEGYNVVALQRRKEWSLPNFMPGENQMLFRRLEYRFGRRDEDMTLSLAETSLKSLRERLAPMENSPHQKVLDFEMQLTHLGIDYEFPARQKESAMLSLARSTENIETFYARSPQQRIMTLGTGRYIASHISGQLLNLPLNRLVATIDIARLVTLFLKRLPH